MMNLIVQKLLTEGEEALVLFSLFLAAGLRPRGRGFLPRTARGLGGAGDSGILKSASPPPALRCSS